MELTQIKDINKFFNRVDDSWIFTGKKLEVYIPKIYQERGLLVLGDTATSLGIFQVRINDLFFTNFMILARVNIEFVSQYTVTEDDCQYTVLVLEQGSHFITHANIVKDTNLIYEIFVTFLTLGKVPPFIDYNSLQRLLDNDYAHCGVKLDVNHSIFEMIIAHCSRDAKDPYKFYRHTQMNEPLQFVPIRQISHGPTSTTARIAGSYLNEGMVASLVDEAEHSPSIVENLLR